MRRELGGFERAQAITGSSFPYNAVAVLRLAGSPAAASLEAALAAVQSRHPLLRCRLLRERGRWLFESADRRPIPLRRIERRDDRHWRAVAEEELNQAFEPRASPLVRCAHLAPVRSREPSEIVLGFHHAIADATSGATVCRRLLSLCGTGEAAGEPAGGARELPPRPEDRFPDRFRGARRLPAVLAFMLRQLADEAGYLWRSRGRRNPAPPPPVRSRVLPVALGEDATAALVRRARRERVPLNSVLNAALLLAVRRRRYGGRTVPLRYFAFPNLRPFLKPPVGPDTVGSYLTTMRFTTVLGQGERLWPLARRITGQLHRSFRRGEKFLFCMTSPGLLRAVIGLGGIRMGSVAVSYTGPLRFPSAFGPLGVRGVHAFVSNMPVGAEYTTQVRLFRGRLWWDIVYLEEDMDEAGARSIADDALGRLEGVGPHEP